MEDHAEQRRHVRKCLKYKTTAFNTTSGDRLGELFDISQQGFRLLAPQKLNPKDTLDITLELPGLTGDSKQVQLTAECIWCGPAEQPPEFGIGFQVISISEQDNVALQYFIRDF